VLVAGRHDLTPTPLTPSAAMRAASARSDTRSGYEQPSGATLDS